MKSGTLYVTPDVVSFWVVEGRKEKIFDIPVSTIKNCTVETKESLTVGRMLLVGLLAWALKKNKQYIRIEFSNELSESNNVVFYAVFNNETAKIIKAINEERLEYIRRAE